jgi:hypothetical protein
LPLTVVDFAALAEPAEADLAAGLAAARTAERLDWVLVTLLALTAAAFDLFLFFAALFFDLERVLADTAVCVETPRPCSTVISGTLPVSVQRFAAANKESEIRRLESPNLAHFPRKSMIYAPLRLLMGPFCGLNGRKVNTLV